MKNRPLLIVALAAIVVLWSMFHSLGGVEGIRRDPSIAAFAFCFVLLALIPFFWFQYRRLQREPMYEAVSDNQIAPPNDPLERTPTILVASRLKNLVLLLVSVVGFSFGALLFWRQPGLCGIAGIASTAPIMAFALTIGVAGLISRERLEITRQGLKHTTFWRSQSWSWDQIRDLTLIKARGFGFSWTSGIAFNVFSSDPYASGPARVTLRPTWPIASNELADMLNRARLQWSSATAAHLYPVRKNWMHYLPMALTWLYAGGAVLLYMGRPCG